MALNVESLRTSFNAVAPEVADLTETFYATLFMRYPAVVPLFDGVDMNKQRRMLANAIKFVIDNLESDDSLQTALKAMGKRHLDYGAKAEHYPAVGECLLVALASVAGDLWTEELERDWAEALSVVSTIMLEGAKESLSAAPVD